MANFEDQAAPTIPGRSRRVLAVSFGDCASGVALQRADSVARALAAELFVVRPITSKHWLGSLLRRRVWQRAMSHENEVAHAFTQTMLAQRFPEERILVVTGGVESILRAAADLEVDVIVVAGSGEGRAVSNALLRRAQCAVLVARTVTSSSDIVAATDFSDPRYPALTFARELGAGLRAPVTFVHNALATSAVSTQYARLVALAEGPAPLARSVVVSRRRSEDAILEIARRSDADLVVVGKSQRSWKVGLGTAEFVARSARRSVLAVPLERAAARALAG